MIIRLEQTSFEKAFVSQEQTGRLVRREGEGLYGII